MKWTKDEDMRLIAAISRHMLNQKRTASWKQISFHAFGCKEWENTKLSRGRVRTAKQCRERWTNYLNPVLIRSAWTIEEDECLLHLFGQLKTKWSRIARSLTGRSSESVKNRVHILTRKFAGKRTCRNGAVQPKQNLITIEDIFTNLLNADSIDMEIDTNDSVHFLTSQELNMRTSGFKIMLPSLGRSGPNVQNTFRCISDVFNYRQNTP